MIRVNHDGILITQKDKIVFYNQQVNNIFEINTKKEGVADNQDDEVEREFIDKDYLNITRKKNLLNSRVK